MSTDRTPPEFDDSDADEIVIEREPDSIEAAVGQFADEASELADRQAAQLARFQPTELPPLDPEDQCRYTPSYEWAPCTRAIGHEGPCAHAPAEPRKGGPTIEQWVAAGYDAAEYPGMGYAVVHSEALDAYGATGVVPQAAIDRAKREERIRRGEEEPSFRAPTCAPRHVPNCECTGDARSQP
jgi:hypothetical protein